jgi:hypothetical protein
MLWQTDPDKHPNRAIFIDCKGKFHTGKVIMSYDTIKLVYFSPTRTTKRILEAVARGMPVARIDHLDLTPPQVETQLFEEITDELTILSAPVYAGRLPIEAVRRLRRLKAREAPAVVVVVYGNRAYEDALLELHDLAGEQGFRPIAAGAFIGEHSYSTIGRPIAHGRPDDADLNRAGEFGERVFQKLKNVRDVARLPALKVPGNFPYKERTGNISVTRIFPSF